MATRAAYSPHDLVAALKEYLCLFMTVGLEDMMQAPVWLCTLSLRHVEQDYHPQSSSSLLVQDLAATESNAVKSWGIKLPSSTNQHQHGWACCV